MGFAALTILLAACGGGGGGGDDDRPPSSNDADAQVTLQNGTKVEFSYPNFGKVGHIGTNANDDGASIVKVSTGPSEQTVTQFVLGFIPNRDRHSLTDWFELEIDRSGSILAKGAYKIFKLENGIEVLDIFGELPDAHLDCCGPVEDLYALSPTGEMIITVTTGQEHSFGNFTAEQARQAYMTMLGSMRFQQQ